MEMLASAIRLIALPPFIDAATTIFFLPLSLKNGFVRSGEKAVRSTVGKKHSCADVPKFNTKQIDEINLL